jgi:dipeptidyl-peptidase-4
MVDQTSTSLFSIKDTAMIPAPGMILPGSLSFSEDNTHLLYLLGTQDDPGQKLWALEMPTGVTALLLEPPGGGTREDSLSLSEVLRRQRTRSRTTGITSYARAERSERILVPLRDGLYVLDGPGSTVRRIAAGEDLQVPVLSPDGDRVAFVRDGEVYVASVEEGVTETEASQITRGGREAGMTNGLAEYVAQEELDRREGFWWSPDGRWVAFEEVDERHIPLYVITHQGKETTGPEAREEHRYPFVGAENAHARLGVVSADGAGAPVWMAGVDGSGLRRGSLPGAGVLVAGWRPGGGGREPSAEGALARPV